MSIQRVYVPALLAQPGLPRGAHSARDFLWSNLIVRAAERPGRSRQTVNVLDGPIDTIVPHTGNNVPVMGQ
jgi:hypothetical protein